MSISFYLIALVCYRWSRLKNYSAHIFEYIYQIVWSSVAIEFGVGPNLNLEKSKSSVSTRTKKNPSSTHSSYYSNRILIFLRKVFDISTEYRKSIQYQVFSKSIHYSVISICSNTASKYRENFIIEIINSSR